MSDDKTLIEISEKIGKLIGAVEGINDNLKETKNVINKVLEDHAARIDDLESSRSKVYGAAFVVSGLVSFGGFIVGLFIR